MIFLQYRQSDTRKQKTCAGVSATRPARQSTPSMGPISESALKHVPAWKKLGLKLKFAKEEPDGVNEIHSQATSNGKKRKNSADSEIAVETADAERLTRVPKKSKSKHENESPCMIVNSDPSSVAQSDDKQSSPLAQQTTPSRKRKSVSFAPEAKTEDGEGVKQVYKKWVEEQIAIDPSFDPSSVSSALKPITPPSVRQSSPTSDSLTSASPLKPEARKSKKPKVRRKKKDKSTTKSSKPSSSSDSTKTDHPALLYLKTYHTDISNWKFSKPHQNHLLKHLFSLTHIPSSHDPAIVSYLKGLKGTSARSRIRTEALTIREEDQKWLASEPEEGEKMDQETHEQCKARRKRDYDAAVARMKAELKAKEDEREEQEWELYGEKQEWEQRVRKRRRAEVVLWGVGEEEEMVEDVVALARSAIFRPYVAPPTIQSKGMGGVETISGTGIAKGSLGRKIVFGDDGPQTVNGANEVNTARPVEGKQSVNSTQGKRKRKRKRKRRTTGVPDDDSSSESSSSSTDDSEEEKRKSHGATKQQANGKKLTNRESSNSGSEFGSDSSSGSSSSDVSHSDSD